MEKLISREKIGKNKFVNFYYDDDKNELSFNGENLSDEDIKLILYSMQENVEGDVIVNDKILQRIG